MSIFAWIRDAVVGGTRADTPPHEIRRRGRRLLFMGFGILLVGLVVTAAALGANEHLAKTGFFAKVALAALFPGFASVIVGGYRMFGSDPVHDDSSPAKRIAIGVGLGCGALIVAVALLILVASIAVSF